MVERAFVVRSGNGFGYEEELVIDELERRNIEYEPYYLKHIRRRNLKLDRSSLVVGDMDCLYGAFKQLGIEQPVAVSYPEELDFCLHRKVWKQTLEELRSGMTAIWPVFLKPANEQKRFTGFVASCESDLHRVAGVTRNQAIECSEVVTWLSEFRIYVIQNTIKGVAHYAGDTEIKLDIDVVSHAIQTLALTDSVPHGYGIDFGVLSSGETALVEMNDGFALGAYEGVSAANYTDLLLARWKQLCET